MYVKIVNNSVAKFPYNIGDLKKENPNISFPNPINENALAGFNVYPVTPIAAPEFDSRTHRVIQGVELVDGKWTQKWTLQDLPEEQASANIRAERNRRLINSDWTQLSDSSVDSTVWLDYRQALRDITNQAGFPWNINWPTKP
tara:strand:- start:203 stop:631 length:429 start_codon:yes stop_codon:yes gene_type:complete